MPQRHGYHQKDFEILISEPLTEDILKQVFRENASGGEVGMNHWQFGQRFVGTRAVRSFRKGHDPVMKHVLNTKGTENEMPPGFRAHLAAAMGWIFSEIQLIRVAAERDISPEPRNTNLELKSNGDGITNVIRAFINSDDLPTYEVTRGLLSDLNYIYGEDSVFTEISCQESTDGQWEIFLQETGKGDIRLSESGSSLKTIFLILTYLRLLPRFSTVNWEKAVLCVEEPENNLHPSLLRRLLEFLANSREERHFTLVITTHSPVCIDWSAKRQDSQILHVTSDGAKSKTEISLGYKHNKGILDDLDVRASDILQANGVIWVEGPSDRVYLNKWISLASNGMIKEGLHYSIMFYAGKLLFHLGALPPDQSDTLISLLSLNRNIALLMDSDRHPGSSSMKPRMNLNATKRRVRDEFASIGGLIWITEGREIENYISPRALSKMTRSALTDIGKYQKIPESRSLDRFKGNKLEIAHTYAQLALEEDLDILDLKGQTLTLVQRIASWNSPHIAKALLATDKTEGASAITLQP